MKQDVGVGGGGLKDLGVKKSMSPFIITQVVFINLLICISVTSEG